MGTRYRVKTTPIPVADIRADHFHSYVSQAPDGCWNWTGRKNGAPGNVYGEYRTRINGKQKFFRAHRVAYALHCGPIPDGAVIDHLCRNQMCVNPAHLEPVTSQVNTARGVGVAAKAAQNWLKGLCGNGHELAKVGLHKQGTGWTCAECGRIRVRKYKARKLLADKQCAPAEATA